MNGGRLFTFSRVLCDFPRFDRFLVPCGNCCSRGEVNDGPHIGPFFKFFKFFLILIFKKKFRKRLTHLVLN
jgi:hypothetical protein